MGLHPFDAGSLNRFQLKNPSHDQHFLQSSQCLVTAAFFSTFDPQLQGIHELHDGGQRLVVHGLLEVDEDAGLLVAVLKTWRVASAVKVEDAAMNEKVDALRSKSDLTRLEKTGRSVEIVQSGGQWRILKHVEEGLRAG